jgi:hypothetical protein
MYTNAARERMNKVHIGLNFIKKVNGFGKEEENSDSERE